MNNMSNVLPIDSVERAKQYVLSKRCVEPIAYSSKKVTMALAANRIDRRRMIHGIQETEQEADDKQRIQNEIAEKMAAMRNIDIDLTDSDIEDFQDVLIDEHMIDGPETIGNSTSIELLPVSPDRPTTRNIVSSNEVTATSRVSKHLYFWNRFVSIHTK